jgi:hypothetical protein
MTDKLEWIIRLEEKQDCRILVRFEPMEEQLHYIGQHKPKNKEWLKFSEIITKMDTNLDEIQITIGECYDMMEKRIKAYGNISSGFDIIRQIKIVGETEE